MLSCHEDAVVSRLLTALAFLTRIPIPGATCTPEAIGRSASVFPVVGGLVGIAGVIVLWIARRAMPPTLTATVIVLTGIALTGALHLDGLADTADGFGGGRTRDDVLRIMRDHQIGTYGAVALVMVLRLQIDAIASLIERDGAGRFLVIAPAASRWAMVLLGRRLPYARPDAGLGRALTDHVGDREVWASTALVIAITIVAASWSGLGSLAATLVLTAGVGGVCRRQIGGVTGDTLGANAVLCETMILVAAVALS
jgi:cobalamin 5'-phosphate synthase/cobalamin synthase